VWIFDIIIAGVLTVAVALLAEEVGGWYRKALWALVVVLVVGLAVVQIVERAGVEKENKRLESDRRTDSDEQRKNLTTVISQNTNLSAAINQLLQRPITTVIRDKPPQPPPTEEAKLQRMSNLDLRAYALDWAKKLRDFETRKNVEDGASFAGIPVFGQDQEARDKFIASYSADISRRTQQRQNEFKNYFWGETLSIYNELIRRYKIAKKNPPDASEIPFSLAGGLVAKEALTGRLAGPNPVGQLADYIEILARNLPG
jgi:hypothetical protein